MKPFLTNLATQGTRIIFVSLVLGLILAPWAKPALAQMVFSQEQAASVLAIENVAVQDGSVSGAIRNKSPNTVRDVQLFIRYTWLWANEFRPGKDNPSEVFYPTVSGEIAPGGSLPFKFTPSSPLPSVRVADSHSQRFPSLGSLRSCHRSRYLQRGLSSAQRQPSALLPPAAWPLTRNSPESALRHLNRSLISTWLMSLTSFTKYTASATSTPQKM
jgi:hypothetical protein